MAAILGLFVVALLISYLPTIYGLFSRREVTVADVSIKSGGTAHGPDLVLHLTRGADTTRLDDMWVDWGHWLITLGETHTSEPSLNFFRSPRVHRSWLTAATAILDAAALRNTLVAAPFSVRAEMTYRSGVEALVGIAHFFFVRPDGDDEHYTPAHARRLRRRGRRAWRQTRCRWWTTSTRPGPSSLKLRKEYETYVLGLCRAHPAAAGTLVFRPARTATTAHPSPPPRLASAGDRSRRCQRPHLSTLPMRP